MPHKKLLYLRTNDNAQLIFIYVIYILGDVAHIDESSTILHMCKWICAYVYAYARLCAYKYIYMRMHTCVLVFVCVYSHM